MARRSNPWMKVVVGLVALGVLGYAFVQSVRDTRAEPYSVPRARLQNWTLAIETPASPADPMLSLRPPAELAGALFRQLFARHAESMSGAVVPTMPLVLQAEFERAFSGHTSPDVLLDAAKRAGLATVALEPLCMAYRRESSPGVTRQLYFLLFDSPAFVRFRVDIGKLAASAGRGEVFDPAALSPVVFVGASDPDYSRWLPLRATPDADCTAPITIA